MKERSIKIGVLVVVFILALVLFSHLINSGSEDMTMEMGSATFPTISFQTVGKEANKVVGHKREMNVAAVRDNISVYEDDGELTAYIHHNDSKVKQLKYEIYTLDGTEKLGGETIDNVEESVNIRIGDALEADQEGLLKITLLWEETPIYYYSRIVKDNEYHVKECVEYVEGLHNDLLTKQNEDGIKKVMESNSEGDNSTLQHVTIHSDFEHVTWGDLNPKVVGETEFEIKEAKKAYTSVLLSYQVQCVGDNNKKETFTVKEFFKVTYGTERVYLMEYDRTMQEVFDTSNVVLGSKGIILGIAKGDMTYKVNSGGTIVAFIQGNELWNYNKEEGSFSLVFSFMNAEKEDERNNTDDHVIRILSMEDNGNMTFSVCGYMNRGVHEGESGVAIYYYNSSKNCVEEEAFIPSTEAYQVIEKELNELAYYNKKQDVLYVMADGTLLKVDVNNDTKSTLIEGLQKGQYVTSEDGHLLAYQKTADGATGIEIWNFAENTRWDITAEMGEVIVPLGFIGNDFVYGVARSDNAGYDTSGMPVQAMHRLEIRNTANEIVKTYEETNVYILGAKIENNMITLKQGIKDGNSYKEMNEDYITNNESSTNAYVELKSYWTDLKETQYRLEFSKGIQNKKAKTLKPKQVLQELPRTLELAKQTDEEYFYVYGHGSAAGVYTVAGEAIQLADKISGVVVSSNQNYVWEDGNKVAWYRNFEISQFTANSGESTLAACVRKVLAYEGKQTDVATELASKSAEQIISEQVGTEAMRLRGCSVKDLFYLIDKGVPVIALKDSTNAILLVGYDAKTVTCIDPSNGGLYTYSIERADEMLKGSGNTFIGYVK